MKKHKNLIRTIAGCSLGLLLLALPACNYLDVVPPEQAKLKDAVKNYDNTRSFLYSCFGGCFNPINYSTTESAADEFTLPHLWNEAFHKKVSDLDTPPALVEWRWGTTYAFIGQALLFKKKLPEAQEITEEQRKDFEACADFIIAYYHMRVLTLYGPCPINSELIESNADANTYPGRSHFDYVTKWICDTLDRVAEVLPANRANENWGLPTSVMAKALKARLLVYAASPLWNGSFPYPEWRNQKWETPGYGKELVSHTYDPQKWEVAEKACQEALDFALANGYKLYNDEEAYTREKLRLPFVPNVDANTPEGEKFLKKVMMLRYALNTKVNEGNTEIIWGLAAQGNIVDGCIPHGILKQNNGNIRSGYSGVSPLLNTTVSYFYTKNGKQPKEDPAFAPESEWYTRANVPGRPNIIKLNVDREPRFYAWLAFDDGDFSVALKNGVPLRINLRDGGETGQGYNPDRYNRDNNVTGYFAQKFIQPNLTYYVNGGGNRAAKPRPLIRLAELYLNLAEAQAAQNKTAEAIKNLNVIRERAGVPNLTTADVGSKSIMDWVRNERFIELWGEGHRYYDIRRWMIAPQTMGAGKRMGLNALVVNPSFETLNTPIVLKQIPYKWATRMYLVPVFNIEDYKNPNLVQAPGYN